MAENLAFLPDVSGSWESSETTPHFYVYDYHGNNFIEAKNQPNYQKYGVLYNWTAATTGACPSGWHLPTDSEWRILEEYLANNGHNYDGTIGFSDVFSAGEKIGKSLASAEGWERYDVEASAVGSIDYPAYRNKSGFSALPGGFFSTGMYQFIKRDGNWWTSTVESFWAKMRNITFTNSEISTYNASKSDGLSVRCIKN